MLGAGPSINAAGRFAFGGGRKEGPEGLTGRACVRPAVPDTDAEGHGASMGPCELWPLKNSVIGSYNGAQVVRWSTEGAGDGRWGGEELRGATRYTEAQARSPARGTARSTEERIEAAGLGRGRERALKTRVENHAISEVGFSVNRMIAQTLGPLKCYLLL